MRDPPLILAVDDTPENLEILSMRLEANGYEVADRRRRRGGARARARARAGPDPARHHDAEARRHLRSSACSSATPRCEAIPVILVTAKADTRDVVAGLDAGGDDYLTKPFEHAALLARVRSMLRQKALHDTVQDQARELAEWNTRARSSRVAEQVDRDRADRPPAAVPAAAGRRPDRRLGRSRDAARTATVAR